MATEKGLTIRKQELEISPQEVVDNSTVQAKLLMNIVNQTHCYQQISGKKYLQVEAWETIGAFNRTHAETMDIIPIVQDGQTIGYRAKVQLWKDGVVIGGAFMPCYFTENCCKGKEGDAKHKACMSAAQTFATSKAYRMNFSYVAILAGYEATPAEEMAGSDSTQPNRSEHFCQEHEVVFFKKGKMKGYAHKIEGTDEWCNELETPPEAPQSAREAPKQETNSNPPDEAGKGKRDPSTIKTITDMYKACHADFGLQPKEVMAELNVKSWSDLTLTPSEAYLQIVGSR